MEAEEEAWRRKLEAGRAKFAYFRQRKAKGDNAQSQKKTAKRKGSSVRPHDLPQEEHALAAQGAAKGREGKAGDANLLELKAGDSNLLESKSEDISLLQSYAEDTSLLERKAGHTNLLESYVEDANLLELKAGDTNQLELKAGDTNLLELTAGDATQLELKAGDANLLQSYTEDASLLESKAEDAFVLQTATETEVNEVLRSTSPGKNEVLEAQQQMSVFQNRLREQNAHLELLREKAHDLEVQLESSQKNTKENTFAQMEENMKDTVQQLHKSTEEKEQDIESLQDLLASERFSLSMLQHTLSLRDSEITGLKNEIALSKMKEQQHIEELKINHEKDIHRQLENLRAELEKCHRREIAEAKQVYEEEMILKYKNELDKLKKELCALNSEEHVQSLNSIIIDLNNSLHESEINKESLRKKLENQQEDFQRKI